MIARILPTLLVLPLVAAAPKPDPTEAEFARLQGKWQGVSLVRAKGKDEMLQDRLDEWAKAFHVEVKGREATATLLMTGDGTKHHIQIRVTLAMDPAPDPKTIDATDAKIVVPHDPKGSVPFGMKNEKPPQGIYHLDGDTLKLGWLGDAREEKRPRSFDLAREPGLVILTLKRCKK